MQERGHSFEPIFPQLKELFCFKKNPEALTKFLLIFEGFLFSSINMLPSMLDNERSYNSFMKPQGKQPDLYVLPGLGIVKIVMLFGRILIWFALFFLLIFLKSTLGLVFSLGQYMADFIIGIALIYLVTILVFLKIFNPWRITLQNVNVEWNKFGTALMSGKQGVLLRRNFGMK